MTELERRISHQFKSNLPFKAKVNKKMSVIVKSSVKEIVKAKNLRCGAEVFEAFDKWAEARIKKAIERAVANGRKTLRPEDL